MTVAAIMMLAVGCFAMIIIVTMWGSLSASPTVEYSLQSIITISYDDGGGNTATYLIRLLGATAPVITSHESKHYRPKLVAVVNPASTITLTSHSQSGPSGSPPATIDITVDSDGLFTIPGSASVIYAIDLVFTIDAIASDIAMYDEAQRAFYEQVQPLGSEFIDGSGTLASVSWATDEGPLDVDSDVFFEVADYLRLYYAGTFDILTFKASDMAFIAGAAILYTADFTLGRSIEQGVSLLMGVTNLSKGKVSSIIGSISEYLQDGSFGDLDLPLEVYYAKVKV